MLILLGLLAGCSSSRPVYRSKAVVSRAKGPNLYHVAFVLEDVSDPGAPKVVTCPRITVQKGKEGTISIGDDRSAIVCTAIVDNTSGGPQAKTMVCFEENGQVVWSESKTVTVADWQENCAVKWPEDRRQK